MVHIGSEIESKFFGADMVLFDDLFLFNVQSFFPAMTKIVGTLGPKSKSVETISSCLKAGMSGTFFFFSFQCYLNNLFGS